MFVIELTINFFNVIFFFFFRYNENIHTAVKFAILYTNFDGEKKEKET